MTIRDGLISSIFLAGLFLGGCGSSPIVPATSTESESIDHPLVGATIIRGLGETLVAKGLRSTSPALRVVNASQFHKEEGEASLWTCALTVPPGTYLKRGDWIEENLQANCFGPVSYQLTLHNGNANLMCQQTGVGDICFAENSEDIFLAVRDHKIELKQDFENFVRTTAVIENRSNLVQELIYNGRVGDTIKFIYRRFSNDVMRPDFTQEVQYDLGKSNVIVFKEMRLEVIDASNAEITYKLLRNFDDN